MLKQVPKKRRVVAKAVTMSRKIVKSNSTGFLCHGWHRDGARAARADDLGVSRWCFPHRRARDFDSTSPLSCVLWINVILHLNSKFVFNQSSLVTPLPVFSFGMRGELDDDFSRGRFKAKSGALFLSHTDNLDWESLSTLLVIPHCVIRLFDRRLGRRR